MEKWVPTEADALCSSGREIAFLGVRSNDKARELGWIV